jgi:class 3 adenylate cyclase
VRSLLRIKSLYDEVQRQKDELAEWNRTLERRVAEGVEQLERVGRLKRFFSPQLAEAIVGGGNEGLLATHRREIVVVFIDLRGFTTFTEGAEPEEVMELLHEYHAAMGRIVVEHGGTLERFAGDSVMVFFNDPLPIERPAEQAVAMALAMQSAFAPLREAWGKRGFDLGLGCGLAQGYATLGAIGFEGRWDYAAIGNVTNLAARLCAEAAGGQILADRKTMAKVESIVEASAAGPFALKGFAHPVPAFAIAAMKQG